MDPRSLVIGYTCDVEVNVLTKPLIPIPSGATQQKLLNRLVPAKTHLHPTPPSSLTLLPSPPTPIPTTDPTHPSFPPQPSQCLCFKSLYLFFSVLFFWVWCCGLWWALLGFLRWQCCQGWEVEWWSIGKDQHVKWSMSRGSTLDGDQ